MTATETTTTTTYTVDPAHSSVEFAVKHLGIATVKGTFDAF
jgi:polyisoprenoid-binding protein YceI